MRFNPAVLVTVVAIVLSACDNEAARGPTMPSTTGKVLAPRLALAGPACSAALFSQGNSEIDQLFSIGPTHQSAERQWAQINTDCAGNQGTAREEMISYIQFLIDAFRAGKVNTPSGFPSPAAALVSHWNTAFGFVNYPEPNLNPTVLGPNGAAGVITQTTVNRELAAAGAAITVPVQGPLGDQRGHLFTIDPIPGGCLSSPNLVQTGPCFQFAANPAVSPVFDPKVKVGICEPVAAGTPIPGITPALGHDELGVTKITQLTGIYPTFCVDAVAQSTGSWTGGFGEVARRLAFVTKSALGVQQLYGAHGGLGGVTGGLSPVGGVDLTVFQSNFSGTIGQPPSATGAGSWFSSATPPSSVAIRNSLGDLTNQPVVLDQGDCTPNCGGVILRGTVTGAGGQPPIDGIYLVSWLSVENKSPIVEAPFVLRSSNGLLIARLSYIQNKQYMNVMFNGREAANWIKGKKQKFEVTVNLNTKKTSLSVNGIPVAWAQNVPFLQAALNLSTFAAEFSALNFGTVGVDDVSIMRLPDE